MITTYISTDLLHALRLAFFKVKLVFLVLKCDFLSDNTGSGKIWVLPYLVFHYTVYMNRSVTKRFDALFKKKKHPNVLANGAYQLYKW